MKKFLIRSLLSFIYFVAIIFIFIFLRIPALFDNHLTLGEDFMIKAYVYLIIFRFLVYFSFPLLFGLFDLKKNKNYIYNLIYNFNVMFFTYSLIAAIYTLFGVDKLLNTSIFDASDIMLFFASFIVTTIIKKEVPKVMEI